MNHTKNTILPLISAALLAVVAMTSCIEDGFTSSASDQPRFSVDTLDMGVVYTDELTTTHRFTVYNPCGKSLNLERVALTGEYAHLFRLNVDGLSGKDFRDIEIRANDSIFVFVDALLPETGRDAPQRVSAMVDFMVNGVSSGVVVSASGQDVTRLKGVTCADGTVLGPGRPYQITDSLVVPQGVTLTLEAGAELRFHDGAWMRIDGTLLSRGTPEAHVRLTGDRTGNVITDVSFDLMSRQWGGVLFSPLSGGSLLECTEISNTTWGVVVEGDGRDIGRKALTLYNCRLRNSGGNALSAVGASVHAVGCEFAEAASSLVYLAGGDHRFDRCTVSNHYLFAAVSGAAWTIPDLTAVEDYAAFTPTRALITNSVTYGLGPDCDPGDFTGREVYFHRCLFKSEGVDDSNFIDSLWGADPLFYTVRSDYLFDYRLKPDSPAISAAYPALSDVSLPCDWYGQPVGTDLGAYTYTPPQP